MNLTNTINFLKTDIRGLIILGIVTSLIAAILYDISKKQLFRAITFIKFKLHFNKIKKLLTYYASGYLAGYAHTSTYRQVVLVGDFIIKIILQIGWSLFSLSSFLGLLILLGKSFSWILVILFSAILTFQYRKLKDLINQYEKLIVSVFGEEFFKKQSKSVKEYFDENFKEGKDSEEK